MVILVDHRSDDNQHVEMLRRALENNSDDRILVLRWTEISHRVALAIRDLVQSYQNGAPWTVKITDCYPCDDAASAALSTAFVTNVSKLRLHHIDGSNSGHISMLRKLLNPRESVDAYKSLAEVQLIGVDLSNHGQEVGAWLSRLENLETLHLWEVGLYFGNSDRFFQAVFKFPLRNLKSLVLSSMQVYPTILSALVEWNELKHIKLISCIFPQSTDLFSSLAELISTPQSKLIRFDIVEGDISVLEPSYAQKEHRDVIHEAVRKNRRLEFLRTGLGKVDSDAFPYMQRNLVLNRVIPHQYVFPLGLWPLAIDRVQQRGANSRIECFEGSATFTLLRESDALISALK